MSQYLISIWALFEEHSRITAQQRKKEAIAFTPIHHFDPLYMHLHILKAIAAERS